MKRVIIVGGGAAGLMAAGAAGSRGLDVTVLEKNDRLGKKIRISGKGRCNISNSIDIEGLIQNTPGNGSFLYSSFYTFSNTDIIELFNHYGLETKVERGGRIFPVSDKAEDVVNTLNRYITENKVKVRYKAEVEDLWVEKEAIKGVILKDGERVAAEAVILATGGVSYPGTGSTGDGYRIAKKWGHTITDLKPSLVPLVAKEEWVKALQGLSLKNIAVKMKDLKGKTIYEDFGEMLFTHFGVSGPVILSGSRHILDYNYRNVKLSIDLKPALNEEKLDLRLQRDFEKYSRKQYRNSLDDLLPSKLIPVIIELSGIDPEKLVNQITRDERKKLVSLLKKLELEIIDSRPVKEAIVTSGGVSTDEINPGTMESKIIKGLYFAGEVIDVDAYTGGYNLTIAFSTGHMAGMNC